MQEQMEVKIDQWMREGFNLYKEHFGLLVAVSLVVVLLSGVTLGILLGPMTAGLIIICLGLYDRQTPKPQFGEVFRGFNYFVQALLFILVWFLIIIIPVLILSIIPVLGQLLVMALWLGLQALLMFALFLIVEKNMGFWEASMDSIATVRSNLWPFLGFGALAALIGSIGSFVCGIGAIFTLPIQYCILTAAYRDVYGGAAGAESFAAAAAPTPPAEPHQPGAGGVEPESGTGESAGADEGSSEE